MSMCLWAGLTGPGDPGDPWRSQGRWMAGEGHLEKCLGRRTLPSLLALASTQCDAPGWAPQERELGTPKPSFPGCFKDTAGLSGWQESLSGLTLGMRPHPRAPPGMYPVLQGHSTQSCLAPSPLCSGSWPSFFLRES